MEESLRLFLALDPTPSTVDRLIEASGTVRDVFRRARWVRREAIHLTLHFFGPVPGERAARIDSVVGPVVAETRAFEVEIAGLGVFPTARNPAVVWAGVGRGSRRVRGLACNLREHLTEAGFPVERRDFVPHVTLARMRRGTKVGRRAVEDALRTFAGRSFGVSPVRELVLYVSELRPEGALYTPVRRWRFGGPSSPGPQPT